MKAFPDKRYRHYKGGEYTVLAIGRLESDPLQEFVVYRALYETGYGKTSVWIRPIKNFEEEITVAGTTVHRFTCIS